MSFNTKTFSQRLQTAIDKSADSRLSDSQAYMTLIEAMRAEIKTVDMITSMSGFRAWIEGERFDIAKVHARKQS